MLEASKPSINSWEKYDKGLPHLKIGGRAFDTNSQRASELLYETITVSLFTHLLTPVLLVAHGLATRICSFPQFFAFFPTDF